MSVPEELRTILTKNNGMFTTAQANKAGVSNERLRLLVGSGELERACFGVYVLPNDLDKTKQTLKIDITTGDFVTPKEIEYSFRLMFEDRAISIMAYNLETILAEKFETVATRSVSNTRIKDFYDIYILTTIQPFNSDTFRAALQKTAEKRGTIERMDDMEDAIQTVADSLIMRDLWQRYQKKYSYAADVTWDMAVRAVKTLAKNYHPCG